MRKWFRIREKGKNNYSLFAFSIRSMDDEDYYSTDPHNILHIALLGYYWYINIPEIIRPRLNWVDTSHYEWAKANPDGTKGYWNAIERRYGCTFMEDAVHVYYGIQPMQWSSTDKKNSDHTKVLFYPWKETNRVRYSFHNPDGSLFTTLYETNGRIAFDAIELAQKSVPKIEFRFKDFDGEEIEATCHITEMEWQYGIGMFSWIRHLRKPIIRRLLELNFNKEVGYDKGGWKGGTLGHSIEILPHETAEEAFRRYGRSYDRYRNHGTKNRMFTDIEVIS